MPELDASFELNLSASYVKIELKGESTHDFANFSLSSKGILLAEWPAVPLSNLAASRPLSTNLSHPIEAGFLTLTASFESGSTHTFIATKENLKLIAAGISSVSPTGSIVRGWVNPETAANSASSFLEVVHSTKSGRTKVYYAEIVTELDCPTRLFRLELQDSVKKGDKIMLRLSGHEVGIHRVRTDCHVRLDKSVDYGNPKIGFAHDHPRAWVIGNGPSVQTRDLERIPSRDTSFTMNNFALDRKNSGTVQ